EKRKASGDRPAVRQGRPSAGRGRGAKCSRTGQATAHPAGTQTRLTSEGKRTQSPKAAPFAACGFALFQSPATASPVYLPLDDDLHLGAGLVQGAEDRRGTRGSFEVELLQRPVPLELGHARVGHLLVVSQRGPFQVLQRGQRLYGE